MFTTTARFRRWAIGAAAAGSLTLSATTSGAPAGVSPSAAATQDQELVEITVTAEKRDSTVQKTPISMTAISGSELQAQGLSDFDAILNKIGHMPLPPYIHRDDSEEDRDRYQTVFSHEPGSAAAPTAGLHFTTEILDSVRERGVQIETITLHVGLGTFQPVRAEELSEIRLHSERYTLPAATAEAINSALDAGNSLRIAVLS